MKNITAYIEKDVESGMYIGIIPSLIGAHTCAETLDELHIKLQEVAELCIEFMSEDERMALPVFIGLAQIWAN